MWESNQQGHGDQLDDGFRGGEGSQFSSLCGQNPSLSARVEREQWGRPRLKTGIPILKMLSQRQL